MRMHAPWWAAVALVVGTAAMAAAQNAPSDYTQWRGRQRDGSASGFTPPKAWPENLTRRWKVEVGEGYSTPLVVGNRIYTLTRRDGREVAAALDAGSGKVQWEKSYAAAHTIVTGAKNHGQGPKSTPLFYDNKLFTLGVTGIVSCFNASDGTLLWQKPGPAVPTLYANSSMSPIANGSTVIFHVGGHEGGALTAFDARTGDVKWAWSGDGPAYASPIIVTLGGTPQVITQTQNHMVGVSAETGELLWQRPFANKFANNAVSPIVLDDMVIMSGYERGVTAFTPSKRDGKWTTDVRWETTDVSMFMSNPVLVGTTLYGLSQRASGQFFAIDARTGKVLWLGPAREATNTSVVKAGDVLFLLNDDGELVVAKSDPARLDVIRRYTVADSATWAQPVISGSRVFIKDSSSLALWTLE
jgi:outer membrane protein assembly factor BamB